MKRLTLFLTAIFAITSLFFTNYSSSANADLNFVADSDLVKFEPTNELLEEGIKFPTFNDELEVDGYYIADIKTKFDNNINTLHTEAFLIKHYYTTNGDYLESKAVYSAFHKDKKTNKIISKDVKEDLPYESLNSYNINNIEDTVKQLTNYPSVSYVSDYDVVDKLEEIDLTLNCEYNCNDLNNNPNYQSAGAFDNYYVNSGGKYIVQALGGTRGIYMNFEMPHTSLNTRSFNEFKNLIDRYENYVILSMNYNTWADKVSSFSAKMSQYASIGYWAGKLLKGPHGWKEASKVFGFAQRFSKFVEFTSSSYANSARLSASLWAMDYLHQAQKYLATSGGKFERYKYTQKTGFGRN